MLKKHEEKIEQMRREAMEMAAAQRRAKLEKAVNDLKQAKDEEAKLVEELKAARKELSNSTDQLAEVSANLERAKNEFERLRKKDLELVCLPISHAVLLSKLRTAADSVSTADLNCRTASWLSWTIPAKSWAI